MGQEPSKDDAIAHENHEAGNSVAKDDQREDSPAREVPRHHAKEGEAVDIEDAEDPHMDLIHREYKANLRFTSDMGDDWKTPDGELRSAVLPSSNPSLKGNQDPSYETNTASPAADEAQKPESLPQKKPAAPTAPNSRDTKIVMGDEEPAKRSAKSRFLLSGFVGGLLLGPFGFLLILWAPVREKRENVLLVSIGVLMAFLIWIAIVAISVSVTA